jgi:predicted phosphodiesterase
MARSSCVQSTMPLRFIHLSDIHFGQEKGGLVFVHNDVRDQVVEDAGCLRDTFSDQKIDGILVTGDLAYSGTAEEYSEAGTFLDRLTLRVGCPRTAVRVIPGNHDIHRESICKASAWMLSEIAAKGATALDSFLEDEQDREVLYGRLRQYGKFSIAYNCPLDGAGGIAGEQKIPLAPGRTLKFIGLNSALSCGANDEQGKLMLGAKQWVLPRTPGEELVVLCHHPLDWFQDSDEALKYVRSRARVFMSGHEHNPSFDVQPVEGGCDLLIVAAGATTPPTATEVYKYTFNVIEFDWDEAKDGLRVTLFPRVWSDERTRFEENVSLPGSNLNPVVLGCPNFRNAPMLANMAPTGDASDTTAETLSPGDPDAERIRMADDFPLQLLRFFRDLTGAQRLAVLINLGALPTDWLEPLNQSAERRALDRMRAEHRVDELKTAIDDQIEVTGTGGKTNG